MAVFRYEGDKKTADTTYDALVLHKHTSLGSRERPKRDKYALIDYRSPLLRSVLYLSENKHRHTSGVMSLAEVVVLSTRSSRSSA